MKKNRLIAVLLLQNGLLVQSKGFSWHQILGNPTTAVRRLSEWACDELIYLDISTGGVYDINRDDQNYANRRTFLEIINDVAKETFMPITVGGRIRSLKDIEDRITLGADKVTLNSKAIGDRRFIETAAKEFGSQCIVISVDVKLINGEYVVFSQGGTYQTQYGPLEWCKIVEVQGAGEIFLNSIDRDGMKNGYDINLLELISEDIKIPVIACGGVGKWEHFGEALDKTKVDAVAAANIFHYIDQSIFLAKKYLSEKNFNVRKPNLMTIQDKMEDD